MRKGEEKVDLETLSRSPLHHLPSLCLEARSWNIAACLTQASSFSHSQEICLCLASQELLKHFGSLIPSRDSLNIIFFCPREFTCTEHLWMPPWVRREEPDFLYDGSLLPCLALACVGTTTQTFWSLSQGVSLVDWTELFLSGRSP